MMSYPLNTFEGTAEYYMHYRPAYPPQLFDAIVQRFSLEKRGVLLDLGCGTGEMALPLAKYFEHVYAWDPDPDMIRIAKQKTSNVQVANITFERMSSHDLDALQGPLKLVAMGQSFHWMDKAIVLEQLHRKLEARGGIVIVGGVTDTPQDAITTKKNEAVQQIVAQYLGPKRRAGNTFYVHPQESFHDLLAQAGFRTIAETLYEYQAVHSIDEVVGSILSMSWASIAQLQEKTSAFENDLRTELNKLSASGQFVENIKFSCFMADVG